ncbi:MAG: hypothetical protein JXO51_02125 [Candidatus Aminicenantes bacterium]|nr:hypothetical protein [Candidatus Aminicenantes bacterium]
MRTPWRTLALLAALALPLAGQDRLELSGSCRSFSILLLPPAWRTNGAAPQEADMAAVNNRLRIHFCFQASGGLSLDAAYDLSPRIQDSRFFDPDDWLPGIEAPGYRCVDFSPRLYPGPGARAESFALFHNLDRLCLTLKLKFADVFLGRQALAWGSARIINPTDVIAPFGFNELDAEERRGVDALRVRVPLGRMDELDLGVVAGENFAEEKSAFFLRGKTYLWKTDLSLLLMAFREHLLVGFDLSRSLGGAGIWLELAHVSDHFFSSDPPEGNGYFRASLGLDASFRNGWYAFCEYHCSSAGAARAEEYLSLPASAARRDGSVYLLGRHYLGAGMSKTLTGLVTSSALLLANLGDTSLILSPQLEYNIAEDIYIAAGAYLGLGKKPERDPDPSAEEPILLHSEFGAYPDTLYASFRIYF